MYNTHSVEYTDLLNRANLPSLQNRHLQDLATLMYKAKYGLVPSNVVDIFSIKSSKYQVRNMDFLFYPDLIVYITGNILYGTLDHIYMV